ncbi:hypothetical protein CFP56_025675 [Quercus suber]|uniref:Uncharacterized protein n=1 Tax=Quercus suber TaxID=58331 RepID=A0AAW0K4F0_QUESU
MGLKKNRWIFFRRLRMQTAWRWKFLGSAFKWKRLNLHLSFVDDIFGGFLTTENDKKKTILFSMVVGERRWFALIMMHKIGPCDVRI